ncbi:MAG: NAD(P)-dependent oxidoreductase [Acidobacteriota bacterium]
MKILVTGGSGYLGIHVRKYLNADDLSRRAGFDILDENDVRMVRDYDAVIHLAAQLDKLPEAADLVFKTNVEGTLNLLRQMRKDSVFIFASTKDVYGPFADNFREVPEKCPTSYASQSALEWSKLIAERYVEYYAQANGFRACILRMSTVFAPQSDGNVSNFVGHYADAINKGEPFILPGDGSPTRDFLHVDDFSAACVSFTESIIRRGLYNIGGGTANALTLNGLISLMEEVSGLQASVDKSASIDPPRPLNYVTDIKLISQELGWGPKISLAEGLKSLF